MPPFVSIIVPCFNEQDTIRLLLEAILNQTYPREYMEVVIADGLSEDQTRRAISSFQAEHPDLALRLVDNERRTIPSGLNLAIQASRGDILVRLDAHSIPIPEYVARSVRDLEEGRGSNVGGLWEIQPGGRGWLAESIAAAASHPLGVGNAFYRLRPSAGAVDTVPFGGFRRGLVEEVGGFDETLLANEDYEFNARIRQSGGVVWLNPEIRSAYIARGSLSKLAHQYWRYGFWKFRMLRRYPRTTRWRQALPPLFVASLVGLAILSAVLPLARFALFLEASFYLLVLSAAGAIIAGRQRKPLLLPGVVLAMATMHVCWGGGFLWSPVAYLFNFRKHG